MHLSCILNASDVVDMAEKLGYGHLNLSIILLGFISSKTRRYVIGLSNLTSMHFIRGHSRFENSVKSGEQWPHSIKSLENFN